MQPFKIVRSFIRHSRLYIALFLLCFALSAGSSAYALTFKSNGDVVQNTKNESKSKSGNLTKSDDIMSFDVSLSSSALKNLKRLPFEFDFSKHEIWTDMSQTICSFEIKRRAIEERRVETMATGQLEIENGVFNFLQHLWNTKGMSDQSYLKEEGNLKILKNGEPIGKMPYFHLYINKGEVAQPPLYVELTGDREQGDKSSPEGVFSFYVDDWQEGLLSIKYCRPST